MFLQNQVLLGVVSQPGADNEYNSASLEKLVKYQEDKEGEDKLRGSRYYAVIRHD